MGVSPVYSKVNSYERNSFSFPEVTLPEVVEMSDHYSKNTFSIFDSLKKQKSQMSRKSN